MKLHAKINTYDVAAFCISVYILNSSLAFADNNHKIGVSNEYFEDGADADFYFKYASLKCGKYHVSVMTSCRTVGADNSGAPPLCASQTVDFIGMSGGFKSVMYGYTPNNEFPDLIVGIGCIRYKSDNLIVLSRTNYSNCLGCEWSDFYSESGDFLGTDGNSTRNYPLKYRELDKGLAKYMSTREYVSSLRSVEVDRNPE